MEPQYWRIRMRFNDKPLEDRAWNRNVVGIGYGAWSADDLEAAIKLGSDKAGAEYLNERPRQKKLHGPDAPQKDQWCVKVRDFQTVTHFRNISLADWVYTYFSGTLHFARVCSDVRSNEDPELQPEKELLKFSRDQRQEEFRTLSSASHLPFASLCRPRERAPSRGNQSYSSKDPLGIW